MPISREQLTLLRLSDPVAAFAALKDELLTRIERDKELGEAFRHFKMTFPSTHSERITELEGKGAGKLGITVGSLPQTVGPGLALMYDAAIQALQSPDTHIDPSIFTPHTIRVAERLLDLAFEKIGSYSVIALERALANESFANRLRERARELSFPIARDNPVDPTQCEYCTVIVKDSMGNETVTCPGKDSCDSLGGSLLILLLIWLVCKLFGWL